MYKHTNPRVQSNTTYTCRKVGTVSAADTDSVPDPCVERSSAMKFNNRWRSLGDTELRERKRHGGPPRATPLRGGGDWESRLGFQRWGGAGKTHY